MKIPNPDNPIFVQKNDGVRDPRANIAGSWNCDFGRYPGKVMPSPRLIQNTNTTDDADLTTITGIVEFDNNYWGVGEDYTWLNASPITGPFTQDDDINAPINCDTSKSDFVVFNGAVLVSTNDDIDRRDDYTNNWVNDWYTGLGAPAASLSTSYPHPLEVSEELQLLFIGNGNEVNTVDTSGTVQDPHLTLALDQTIIWIRATSGRVYIGTKYNGKDGYGLLYEWDGGDTNPTRTYKVNALGSFTATVINDVLYIVTTTGEIQRLDPGGLIPVAKLPIVNSYRVLDGYRSTWEAVNIQQRSATTSRGKMLINTSSVLDATTDSESFYQEYFPSGIWEYDPRTGSLHHKYSYTLDKTGVLDMGQWAIPKNSKKHPGAIIPINATRAYSVLASGGYYTDSGSTDLPALYVDDHAGNTKRRARLWTNQIFTTDTASFFQKITLKYGKMKNSGDKILVKYRTNEDANYPATGVITWSDTDTFTTTDTSFANVVAGDEIFVLTGNGGGSSAHISSISEAGGTYTVNLDEAAYGVSASDTGTVAVENWKKLDSFNDQKNGYREMVLNLPASPWIQVLVELRSDGGNSPILEEIDIIPTKHQ